MKEQEAQSSAFFQLNLTRLEIEDDSKFRLQIGYSYESSHLQVF